MSEFNRNVFEEMYSDADETLDHYDMANHIYITQQAKIDELQAKYDELNNRATGVALDQMTTAKLNYELQARVDETLKILKGWDDQSYRDDMDQLIGEIEDILKGNSHES